MTLGLTLPLTEVCISNPPGDKGGLAHKADKLTAISESTVQKMLEPLGPVTEITFPLLTYCHEQRSTVTYKDMWIATSIYSLGLQPQQITITCSSFFDSF
jgi:hypothetical protein